MFILIFHAEGEVFYMQQRVGKNQNTIFILKFATMLKNSVNLSTGTITTKNDYRVTKVGKILRKSKLNELPQILNVLAGNLSVVGPRPLPKIEFDLLSENSKNVLFHVKPGITGIGSLIFRDEEAIIERNNPDDPMKFYQEIILPFKGELEIWYRDHISFINDIKILFLTFYSIIIPVPLKYHKYFKDLPSIPEYLQLS